MKFFYYSFGGIGIFAYLCNQIEMRRKNLMLARRLRTIRMLLLGLLLMGLGMISVLADDCEALRRQLPQLQGRERVAALEQLYYCSLDSDDLDYQLRCINEYLAETRRQGLKDVEIDVLAERAAFFYNNDMNDSVFTVVRRDLETVKASQNWETYYEMWAHIANTYLFLHQNKLGLNETQAMFDDAVSRNSQYGMGLAYCIMGTAYANLRNFDESISSYEKSLATLDAIHPVPSLLPTVYQWYGDALNDMKAYDKLEDLTKKWDSFLIPFLKENNWEGTPQGDMYLSYYYLACAQAALGQGKLPQADEALTQARTHMMADESRGGKWLFYMAQLRLQQGRPAESLGYNSRFSDLMEGGSDKSVTIMLMQQRAEALQLERRYEEAANLYREMYLFNDSVNAQETKGQLTEMNTIFQVSELEMEQERLQMEKERDQFRFFIIVVSLIVLSLAVFLFFRIRAARKLKQAHTELQQAYADLQAANKVIEETTAAKERIESELRIARDIQKSMVPSMFPERGDLDLYASMTPAKEVGGDLYSYLLEGDKLYFCVGDVSGKGVPASLFMAQATRLFHTLAKQQLPTAEIATRLNDELAEDNEQGMFVTMFIGLVDLTTGHLDFCNAGHNPPVVDGQFMEMEPNAPIGLWPGLEYVGEQLDDISGKPLFIYTDGLNEAENAQQEQFGDDHLLQFIADTSFDGAQQLIERMSEEVERHVAGAEPSDDLTMMCVVVKNNQQKAAS